MKSPVAIAGMRTPRNSSQRLARLPNASRSWVGSTAGPDGNAGSSTHVVETVCGDTQPMPRGTRASRRFSDLLRTPPPRSEASFPYVAKSPHSGHPSRNCVNWLATLRLRDGSYCLKKCTKNPQLLHKACNGKTNSVAHLPCAANGCPSSRRTTTTRDLRVPRPPYADGEAGHELPERLLASGLRSHIPIGLFYLVGSDALSDIVRAYSCTRLPGHT